MVPDESEAITIDEVNVDTNIMDSRAVRHAEKHPINILITAN